MTTAPHNDPDTGAPRQADGKPIRVVIVEDHDTMRRALCLVFDHCEDVQVVAEVCGGRLLAAPRHRSPTHTRRRPPRPG